MSQPVLLSVVFPNLNIGGTDGTGGIPTLGHGGFIAVNEDGKAAYYDYGKYDATISNSIFTTRTADEGNIRKFDILTPMTFDQAGNVTAESLKSAMNEVIASGPFSRFGDIGRVSIGQFKMEPNSYNAMMSFITDKAATINDGKAAYDLLNNNCIDFLYGAARSAGLQISSAQNTPGTNVPSLSDVKIEQQAQTRWDYYSPKSWTGSNLDSTGADVDNLGASQRRAIVDRLWQAARAFGDNAKSFLETYGQSAMESLIKYEVDPQTKSTSLTLLDDHKRLLSMTSLASDGSIKHTEIGSTGRAIREVLLNPDTLSGVSNQFSPDNKIIDSKIWHQDGSTVKQIYDPISGRKSAETQFDPNGVVRSTSTFNPTSGTPTSTTKYDVRGVKFQDIKYNPDGSRVENHFDTSNTQPWKQAEQRFGTDGKLSYQQNTNRDGSRIEWAYSPQSGQATWERKVAADGSRVDRNLDPDNKAAWSEGIYQYDTQNGLVHSTERSDDGTRWEKNFDPHNQYGWKQGTYQYNPQNQLTNSSEVSDDNSRTERTFNPQTGQATVADNFNSQGQHTYHSDINSDGSRTDSAIDPATGRITQVDRLNAGNQVTNRSLFNADGSRVDIDLDPTNAASWARGEYTYNPSGQLIGRDVTMDNGSRVHTDLDPSNAASWKEGVYEYGTDGKLWKRTVTMDDGQTQVEDYDPGNTAPWSKGTYRFNAAGQMLTRVVDMDDQSRTEQTFNPTTGKETLQRQYDSNGKLTYDSEQAKAEELRAAQAAIAALKAAEERRLKKAAAQQAQYEADLARFRQQSLDYLAQQQAFLSQPTSPNRPTVLPPVGPPPASPPLVHIAFTPQPFPLPRFVGSTGGGTGGGGSSNPQFVSSSWHRLDITVGSQSTSGRFRDDHYNNGSYVRYYDNGHVTVYDKDSNVLGELDGGPTNIGSPNSPPVLLDLDGDGLIDLRPIDLTAPDQISGPHFDWNEDGKRDGTAWVGPKDGFLVIDLGGDGKIDQARELAFALWKTDDQIAAENGHAVTDLEGLRYAFDTNKDNVLDSNDQRWNEFRVWQDINQNGISDPGELKTMSEAGIKLINLLPSVQGATLFADGSAITGTSSYVMTDGTTRLVGDATLTYRPSVGTA
ncbi:hypothetical protein AB4Y96_09220 [Phyllobacterium sp. TAF24]|uniref:hypothetical protein n=1 Tax=Phyllobacterium sp. TAF24 TaxID=3233068 RepID=UPI003F96BAF5